MVDGARSVCPNSSTLASIHNSRASLVSDFNAVRVKTMLHLNLTCISTQVQGWSTHVHWFQSHIISTIFIRWRSTSSLSLLIKSYKTRPGIDWIQDFSLKLEETIKMIHYPKVEDWTQNQRRKKAITPSNLACCIECNCFSCLYSFQTLRSFSKKRINHRCLQRQWSNGILFKF